MKKVLLLIGIVALLFLCVFPLFAQTPGDYVPGDGYLVRKDGTARSARLFYKGCPTNDCLLWRSDDGGLFGVYPDPAVVDGKLWWPLYPTTWQEYGCAIAAYRTTGLDDAAVCHLTTGGPVLAVFNPSSLAFLGLAPTVGGPIRAVFPITFVPPEVTPSTTPTAVPSPVTTVTPPPTPTSPSSTPAPSPVPSSSSPCPGSVTQPPGSPTCYCAASNQLVPCPALTTPTPAPPRPSPSPRTPAPTVTQPPPPAPTSTARPSASPSPVPSALATPLPTSSTPTPTAPSTPPTSTPPPTTGGSGSAGGRSALVLTILAIAGGIVAYARKKYAQVKAWINGELSFLHQRINSLGVNRVKSDPGSTS